MFRNLKGTLTNDSPVKDWNKTFDKKNNNLEDVRFITKEERARQNL